MVIWSSTDQNAKDVQSKVPVENDLRGSNQSDCKTEIVFSEHKAEEMFAQDIESLNLKYEKISQFGFQIIPE